MIAQKISHTPEANNVPLSSVARYFTYF